MSVRLTREVPQLLNQFFLEVYQDSQTSENDRKIFEFRLFLPTGQLPVTALDRASRAWFLSEGRLFLRKKVSGTAEMVHR